MRSFILFIDQSDALQGQPGGDYVDHFRSCGDQIHPSAGADHMRAWTQFLFEAGDDALHQSDITKVYAGLDGMGGVTANGRLRPDDLEA